jgi:hypothetical protein
MEDGTKSNTAENIKKYAPKKKSPKATKKAQSDSEE